MAQICWSYTSMIPSSEHLIFRLEPPEQEFVASSGISNIYLQEQFSEF